MLPWGWGYIASSLTSILAGLLVLCLLWRRGRHRDRDNAVAGGKISLSVLQGSAFYTLLVCIFGHWALNIPVSSSIHLGFGDERAAWLFLGTAIDVGVRLYGLFDPE
jgi:hypothetical protein